MPDTLPNISGWLAEPPDHRDFKLAEHRPDIFMVPAIPSKYSVRALASLTLDQAQEGSCTAFGSLDAAESTARKMGIIYPSGSRQAQYYWSRLMQGWQNVDSGAYIRDAVKVLATTGMADTMLWPYSMSMFTAPTAPVIADAAKRKTLKYIAVPNDGFSIKATIFAGYPVIVGFSVPANFPMSTTTGMVPMPSGDIVGGHCVLITGYDDSTGLLEFHNSWGTGWGAQGYGYMPYQFLQQLGADFWMISEVAGVTPAPIPPATRTIASVTVTFSDGTSQRIVG